MRRSCEKETRKFTKIVATISGATCTPELLADLYDRGMDVMRMNTAHMELADAERLVAMARAVSPKLAVMLDTKGPNIRTCSIAGDGLQCRKGQPVKIAGTPEGDVCVNYPAFAAEVPVGSRIVCDDGAAAFRVTGAEAGMLVAEPLFDCTVLNRKSVNVPDVSLHAPALTDKDRLFLAAAARIGCDWIAHSFVRNADDIREVRCALGEAGSRIGIIAKIENREGVNNIKEILAEADGIMVARGDLGIEIPLEEVPAIQKRLISEARQCAKPVITATQMLQSMENAPAPTRAEVSDVANAVFDGTDAVMLSGETAHGSYPREAVSMMSRIVLTAEQNGAMAAQPELKRVPEEHRATAYLLAQAVSSTWELPVKAVICNTFRGKSARVCSALRPQVPIYAATPDELVMRQLVMSYGVFPALVPYNDRPDIQASQAVALLTSENSGCSEDDLVAFLGKHNCSITRNDLLGLATVRELRCIGRE